MGLMQRLAAIALLILLGSACAPPPPTASGPRESQTQPARAPKRITAAIRGNPAAIQQRAQPDTVRGLDALENLSSAGATQVSVDGIRISQLADPVPSLENGLWQLMPDGRMTMTWRIRPNLRWHDGAPLTSDDFVFATMVE